MHYYLNVHTKESQWDLPTAPAEPVASQGPSQIQASHLLVKHNKSRRPSSWREENIVRSKEEAREILEEYKKQVNIILSITHKEKIQNTLAFLY